MNLTAEQHQIIELSTEKHLVLAPPGSGKTELLSRRIDFAQTKNFIKPNDMVCLTFTNRAARNMINRIPNESMIFVGTFHTFCTHLLFKNHIISKQTTMLPEDESKHLMEEALAFVLNDENISPTQPISNSNLLRYNAYLNQINLELPDYLRYEIPKDFDLLEEQHLKKIAARYEWLKHSSIYLDFDDIINLTIHALIHSKIKTKYSWIQVDEVQDLNLFQWEILERIQTESTHLTLFGDFDQCIYSFIGARHDILAQKAQNAKTHYLHLNFRSPSYLLELFNSFSHHFFSGKQLLPQAFNHKVKHTEDLIYLKKSGSKYSELNFLAEKLIPHYLGDGNISILTRTNRTADDIANILFAKNLPFFKISGIDLFQREIIKHILAYLIVLIQPQKKHYWARLFYLTGTFKTISKSRVFVDKLISNGLQPIELIFNKEPLLNAFVQTSQNRIVLFDTESTGLDTSVDDIIQIAAIEIIDGYLGNEFEIYIKTDKSLVETVHIHHINESILLEKGEEKHTAFRKFIDFVNNDPLFAHNMNYDWNILKSNLTRAGLSSDIPRSKRFDTLKITQLLFPREKRYTLEYLLQRFDLEGVNSHNALDDVRATCNLYFHLLKQAKNIHNASIDFYESNEKVIEHFVQKVSPLFLRSYERKKEKGSIIELFELFLNSLKDINAYEITDSDKIHLQKLIHHIRVNEKGSTIGEKLRHLIPKYEQYKESDLLVGDEKIVVSTIHKAKGLEFDTVIIPECNDGVYPSWNSENDEEEKRLFYVALTRAKKKLILSSHNKRTDRHFQEANVNPSYFLEPILKHFKTINR